MHEGSTLFKVSKTLHFFCQSYDIDGMPHLLGVFEAFFESSGLTRSVDKTKKMVMVVETIQPTLVITYAYI